MALIRTRLLRRRVAKLRTLVVLLTRMTRAPYRLIKVVKNTKLVARRRVMYSVQQRLRTIRLTIDIPLNANTASAWVRLFTGRLWAPRMRVRTRPMLYRANRARKLERPSIATLRVLITLAILTFSRVRLMSRSILRRRTLACLNTSYGTLIWTSTRSLYGPYGVTRLLCVLFFLT